MNKGKKIFFCLVAATAFLSCKNEVNDPVSKEIEFKNEKELSLILPEKYEEIKKYYFKDMIYDFSRNASNDVSVTETLVRNELLTDIEILENNEELNNVDGSRSGLFCGKI